MEKKERRGSPLSNLDWLRVIIKGAAAANVRELNIGVPEKQFSLYLRFQAQRIKSSQAPQEETPLAVVEQMPVDPYEDETRYYRLTTPLTGEFYRRPHPQTEPFIEKEQFVEEGQALCIIAANKMFNQLLAERSGRVVRIVVENEALVQKGDLLMVIDTTAPPPKIPYSP